MRLISWNIDSLNAALTSDSARAKLTREILLGLAAMQPDVLALQETKLPASGPSKKHQAILQTMFADYQIVWRSSVEPARKGYAGTMFLYKKSLGAVEVTYPEIGAPDTMDSEGRMITLEFPDFYVTQVYTPNAGGELKRLELRQAWDRAYADYLAKLDAQKPVLASGDFNAAYQEIDLRHPESNHHSAGFTDEERAGFGNLLATGFTDTFRTLHGPVEGYYTWWAQRVRQAKANNSGWRIDYWLVSNRIYDQVIKSDMIATGERADHCPILLEISL